MLRGYHVQGMETSMEENMGDELETLGLLKAARGLSRA